MSERGRGPAPTDGPITDDELRLATRNRGMPLEALRYDVTPTGLHYLLVHFDIPAVDPERWLLTVTGAVGEDLAIGMDDLRAMPSRTVTVTLECAGNGRARLRPRPISQPWLDEAVGTARWTGTPLREVLGRAQLHPDAVEIVFTGADKGTEKGYEHHYARSLTTTDALGEDVLLAYDMNGRPLEPQHGAPLRLLVPGWYGMTSVKWLTSIDVVTTPFDGYQQVVAYRYKRDSEDPGEPVERINPRALMIPPGFPDFLTRRRTVDRGMVELRGRAWSGHADVVGVEVGVDGEWHDARLEEASDGPYAWRGWSWTWDADPGDYVLSCRATDASGRTQPVSQPWNLQGMGNNQVQCVDVTVC